MKMIWNKLNPCFFSLAGLTAIDVCLFGIIHKASFDPLLVGMPSFTKAYFGGVLQALLWAHLEIAP